MKTSDKGLAEIASHEGIVQMPYRDSVGIWTYGIGHTRAAGPPDPATMPKGVARPVSEVMELFAKDIAKYEADVDRAIKVPVNQHQFDALVSFHYNTGSIARATLTKLVNKGDMEGAARAFMNWTRPIEITERRRKEQALFRTGIYGNGYATVYTASASGRVLWSQGKRINVLEFLDGDQPKPVTKTLRYYQEVLLQLGYNPGPIDGKWGPKTSAAVKAFQADHPGLWVDGILGPLTSAAIDRVIAAPREVAVGSTVSAAALASTGYMAGFTLSQVVALATMGVLIYLTWRYREHIKERILSWIGW